MKFLLRLLVWFVLGVVYVGMAIGMVASTQQALLNGQQTSDGAFVVLMLLFWAFAACLRFYELYAVYQLAIEHNRKLSGGGRRNRGRSRSRGGRRGRQTRSRSDERRPRRRRRSHDDYDSREDHDDYDSHDDFGPVEEHDEPKRRPVKSESRKSTAPVPAKSRRRRSRFGR